MPAPDGRPMPASLFECRFLELNAVIEDGQRAGDIVLTFDGDDRFAIVLLDLQADAHLASPISERKEDADRFLMWKTFSDKAIEDANESELTGGAILVDLFADQNAGADRSFDALFGGHRSAPIFRKWKIKRTPTGMSASVRSTLGELESPAGAALAVLLSLDFSRVA